MSLEGDRLVNLPAEAALLGAMLVENGLIVELADRVGVEDFADDLHGRIYSAMLRFRAKDKRVDAMTLKPIFKSDGNAQYGDYLDALVDNPAVAVAAPSLADQVADLSARRKARTAMQDAIVSLREDFDRPVDEITGLVEAAGSAAAARTKVDEVYDAGGFVRLVQQRVERIKANPDAVGLSNALVEEVDRGLGRLERGTYTILAGRPGMGKSAAASSIAIGYAINGHPGVYLNHEMKAEQLALRTTADLASAMNVSIDHKALREGMIDRAQFEQLMKVEQRAKLLPLRYISPGKIDIRRVWSIVAQQKAMWEAQGKELEFVVIDYMGLLRARDDQGREIIKGYDLMKRVSAQLKDLAEKMDIALIALAQLSRSVEQRMNKRPILSDLKESGDLEQDADAVCLLYRHEYYLEQERPKVGEKAKDGTDLLEEWEGEMASARNKMDLIFAKNRHGKVSTQTCRFYPEISSVRSGDFTLFDLDESEPLLDWGDL